MKKKNLKKRIKDLLKVAKIKEDIIEHLERDKQKLKIIIGGLKVKNTRLQELNKQGLSEDLERGFNDLLNTGKSVSGPFKSTDDFFMTDANGLPLGWQYPVDEFSPNPQNNMIAKSTEPKEQSSTEMWKEWAEKPNPIVGGPGSCIHNGLQDGEIKATYQEYLDCFEDSRNAASEVNFNKIQHSESPYVIHAMDAFAKVYRTDGQKDFNLRPLDSFLKEKTEIQKGVFDYGQYDFKDTAKTSTGVWKEYMEGANIDEKARLQSLDEFLKEKNKDIEPKYSESEMFVPQVQKGVFDRPKYRSPFFKISTFSEIERAKENEAPMEFHTNSEIKDDHIAGEPI